MKKCAAARPRNSHHFVIDACSLCRVVSPRYLFALVVHYEQFGRDHDRELDFVFFHAANKYLDIALAEEPLRWEVGLRPGLEFDFDGVARFARDDTHAVPFVADVFKSIGEFEMFCPPEGVCRVDIVDTHGAATITV